MKTSDAKIFIREPKFQNMSNNRQTETQNAFNSLHLQQNKIFREAHFIF